MTPVLLMATQHTGCKLKKRTNIIFTTLPGKMIKCAVFRVMRREKEKFWTVVLDTINYIYCLKLV